MLVGTFQAALSPKRRTAIPKKFLKELGHKVIMAKWYEGCLALVGEDYWLALLKRLTGGETRVPTEPIRDTERFILGSAYEVLPDEQGRVVIPAELVLYADLSEKLVFIGLMDRIEIWNEETWREKEKSVAVHAGELVEKLANEQKR